MRLSTSSVAITCPYCGEPGEIIIDPSVDQQEYIEDCWVCCRPIVMAVTVLGEEASVSVRAEDE